MAVRLSRGLDIIGGKGMVRGKHVESAAQKVKRYKNTANGGDATVKRGPTLPSSGLEKIQRAESGRVRMSNNAKANLYAQDMKRNFSEQGGMNRVGVSALRGAVVGGVAGGGIESMQGGDFWDGAKSGAFYGATGMAAARGARQVVGAQAYRGKDGIMGTMKMNKEAYGVGVKDIMLNKQNVDRAKNVMGRVNRKNK